MHNRIIHFEIHATDPKKLIPFYQDIFGWTFTKWESPAFTYWIIATVPEGSTEPGINGGIVKRMGAAPVVGASVSAFVCTIHVPNVDEYLKKIEEAGGKIALQKMAIPGLAWLAYAIDTDGNIFGIYEDDKNAK